MVDDALLAENSNDTTHSANGAECAQSRMLQSFVTELYEELHGLAGRFMRHESRDHTLQATALVHEAFIKLLEQRLSQWKNNDQILALAAQAMRRILLKHAERKRAQKRGGGMSRVSLDAVTTCGIHTPDVIALNDALQKLKMIDEQKATVVELRYFGGMTIEMTAETMRISPATVKREWHIAKMWLMRELSEERP